MKVLFVKSVNDYDALTFENKYGVSPKLELWERVRRGEVITIDDDELEIEALDFPDVPMTFIEFVQNKLLDYDQSKHSNFFICK